MLNRKRLDEIMKATAFECHKTTGVIADKKPAQQCAGLIAVQHVTGTPNTITQVAKWLTSYDPEIIDTRYTYDSLDDLYAAHGHVFASQNPKYPRTLQCWDLPHYVKGYFGVPMTMETVARATYKFTGPDRPDIIIKAKASGHARRKLSAVVRRLMGNEKRANDRRLTHRPVHGKDSK